MNVQMSKYMILNPAGQNDGPNCRGLIQPSRPAIESALLINALSASRSGHTLDSMLAHAINTPNTTIYDRAIDSAYLSTGVGGSHLHHLVDGHHDLVGAFEAARAATPHGSLGSEVLGTAHHLAKDLFSVMGLPVVSIKPDAYAHSSSWIQNHLGISKGWQADFLQINGMELLGGGLAAAAVVLGAQRGDVHSLFEVAGSSGLAGTLAANPIAMMAGSVALIMALLMRKNGERWTPHLQRAGVGIACSATAIAAGSLLGGLAGGGVLPLAASLALSLTAGIAVRQWLLSRMAQAKTKKNISVPDVDTSIWQTHIESISHRIWSQADQPALALLRKALQPT